MGNASHDDRIRDHAEGQGRRSPRRGQPAHRVILECTILQPFTEPSGRIASAILHEP
jgi:hypothetical protein